MDEINYTSKDKVREATVLIKKKRAKVKKFLATSLIQRVVNPGILEGIRLYTDKTKEDEISEK